MPKQRCYIVDMTFRREDDNSIAGTITNVISMENLFARLQELYFNTKEVDEDILKCPVYLDKIEVNLRVPLKGE